MSLEAAVPDESVGAVNGDLNSGAGACSGWSRPGPG